MKKMISIITTGKGGTIFFLCLLLTMIGLLALYSISLNQQKAFFENSFVKQLIFLIPAIILMGTILSISTEQIHKYIYIFYGLMIVSVLIPYFLNPVAGTYRWISLGSISIQPSEFSKIILIVTLARYLSDPNIDLRKISSFVFPLVITFIPVIIVMKQPDLGTAVILMTPILPMLYWAGGRPYHIFLLVAPILSVLTAFHTVSFTSWAIIIFIVIYLSKPNIIVGVATYFTNIFLGLLAPVIWNSLKSYQQNRILTFFNPESDPLGAAYQIIQSQTAIGSGGFWGKGFANGTQTHLKFLPVQDTDFILSVIGEEFGFIAIFSIMAIFLYILLIIIKKSFEAKDRFSGLVLFGITVIFLAHLFVNAAMTVGLMPVKGLPLPFISYGGSFLLACYIMVGLVLKLGHKEFES